ncbi:MAG TPA: class I SAM-dependent methyltransferase [Bacteroidia bacterium]|jgi:SAM-dependent methyltransferase|nr:class I SAM-dependent methyltransferase [Bacteroidia bacterium]
MLPYTSAPLSSKRSGEKTLDSFVDDGLNADYSTLASFAEEWKRFGNFSVEEQEMIGREYFDVLPENYFSLKEGVALDVGCGSGRWSALLATKMKFVEAVDPGEAAVVALKNLAPYENVRVTQAGFRKIPFAKDSFDLVFCVGVLHHVPDPAEALKEMFGLLKRNGRILLYVYYDLSSRSGVYRFFFHITEFFRKIISKLPIGLRFFLATMMFYLFTGPYVTKVKIYRVLFPKKKFWRRLPLGYYADKSFKNVKNDTLDRFCTPVARRFSRKEVNDMMTAAGFSSVKISDNAPWWHLTAVK